MAFLARAVVAWLCASDVNVALRGDVPEGAAAFANDVFATLDALAPHATKGDVGLTVVRDDQLAAHHEGQASPGVIRLSSRAADPLRVWRHELAHQWLLWRCPAATDDRLLHEAVAMGIAGEVAPLPGEQLPSLLTATQRLNARVSLDSLAGRSALKRVLSDSPSRVLPRAIERKLSGCGVGEWSALTTDDLVASDAIVTALVLWDRHAKRVVHREGESLQLLPVGSTLKPFVVAGFSGTLPVLRAKPTRGEWSCGEPALAHMDATQALARSCNGYFLDWEAALGTPLTFGRMGEVLREAGLQGDAQHVRDAIGLNRALSISPEALARAYAEMLTTHPQMQTRLSQIFAQGTLREAASALKTSPWAGGKTGTIRDAQGATSLGWLVLVSDRYIAIAVESGKRPSSLLAPLLRKAAAASASHSAAGL